MITVFVSGAGGGVGQGIIKSLKLIDDLDIRIVAADMGELAPGLYCVDRSYLIPAASDDGYIDAVMDIFERESVDYYFPGTDVELLKCAENATYIQDKTGVKVFVSPSEAIQIADDKYLTYEFLSKHDLPAPKSYLPTEELDRLEFPVIVKPRIGCRSIGVSVARSRDQMNNRLESEEGLMIQELVGADDEEFTCTVASINGRVSEALILRRVLRAGDTFRAVPVDNPVIADYVKKIASKLGVEGSCNFQLRLSSGTPKVFEINCRFSGTTPFCSMLGFNPVEFCLKTELGKEYSTNIDYDSMILRHWTESVIRKEDVETMAKNRKIGQCNPRRAVL